VLPWGEIYAGQNEGESMMFKCGYCKTKYDSLQAATNCCTDRDGGKNEYGRWA